MNDTTTVLEVQNLTKAFGSFQAVKQAHFTVSKGEIFGFLGPNGAGKSTTIRLILDILKPTDGMVVLFGEPGLASHKAHSRIGYLSGDMVLDEDLTGEQYLGLVSKLYDGGHGAQIDELAERLQADLSKRIGSYSRGNRQKIGLIAALLHEPELLILDEPSSGFDPLVQETFMELIREYRSRGGTVFMSSHILSEVQQLCDKIAFIKDGEIVSVQTLSELEQTTAKRVYITWKKVRQQPQLSLSHITIQSHDGNKTVCLYDGEITALLNFFAKQPIADITIQEPNLEELFVSYYNGDTHEAK